MENPKKIYCPTCGRYVAYYDGVTQMNVISRCRKCRKRIVYNVGTKEITSKNIPPRNTSSGVSFV